MMAYLRLDFNVCAMVGLLSKTGLSYPNRSKTWSYLRFDFKQVLYRLSLNYTIVWAGFMIPNLLYLIGWK